MKSIKYHNRTEKEALEYTSKLVDFGVTLVVYAALNELLNAYYLLSRSSHFKKIVKKRANEALRQRNIKVRELKDLVMHQGFAETYWDAIVDACEKDIANFKNAIRNTIEDAGIEPSDLLAEMETSRVLLMMAKIHYEEVIRDCTNKYRTKNLADMKHLNLFDAFHEFYIDGIYKEWDLVCDELYKKKYVTVELENDKTRAAFDVLSDKFAKGLYIDECLNSATVEYPEFSGAKIVVED